MSAYCLIRCFIGKVPAEEHKSAEVIFSHPLLSVHIGTGDKKHLSDLFFKSHLRNHLVCFVGLSFGGYLLGFRRLGGRRSPKYPMSLTSFYRFRRHRAYR